jgi:hypothetical protein
MFEKLLVKLLVTSWPWLCDVQTDVNSFANSPPDVLGLFQDFPKLTSSSALVFFQNRKSIMIPFTLTGSHFTNPIAEIGAVFVVIPPGDFIIGD